MCDKCDKCGSKKCNSKMAGAALGFDSKKNNHNIGTGIEPNPKNNSEVLALMKLLTELFNDPRPFKTHNMEVFLKDGTITDVIIHSNKEVDADYISNLIPDFQAIVPRDEELILKAVANLEPDEVTSMTAIFWELVYLLDKQAQLSPAERFVRLASACYPGKAFYKEFKKDFPGLPKSIYKAVKAESLEICDIIEGYKEEIKKPVRNTKNYYNVRDSKGRFTKKAKKRNIKR